MTKDEALKMAIAEIEGWIDHAYGHTPEECADNKTIQACKEALEQPKQFLGMKEIPYKDWVLRFYKMPNDLWYTEGINDEWMNELVEASKSQPAQSEYMVNEGGTGTVLRKSAPSWQGLSEKERSKFVGLHCNHDLVRAIEQALKQKNFN